MEVRGEKRGWPVGALARASGVTVRALHYYDETGLVPASERTRAGHRRYTAADARRLYRVRALHQLGFPLEEIRTMLDATVEEPAVLRHLLDAQLADLDLRVAKMAEVRGRIQALIEQLDGHDMPDPGQFLAALEATVPLVDAQAYLTQDQREAFARRSVQLGGDEIGALKAEWLQLVRQLRRLMGAGVAPGDPRARRLAGRWREIGATLRGATGDDRRISAAVAAMWRDNKTVIDQGMADRVSWLDAGDLVAVVEYVERAVSTTASGEAADDQR